MRPHDLLTSLARRGIVVELTRDRQRLAIHGELADGDRLLLQLHREALLRALGGTPAPEPSPEPAPRPAPPAPTDRPLTVAERADMLLAEAEAERDDRDDAAARWDRRMRRVRRAHRRPW